MLIEFIECLPEWVCVLFMLAPTLLTCLVTLCRTGSVKKLLKKEISELKFKTFNDCKAVPEKFSPLKPLYKYNEITGQLIDTGEVVNVQDEIDSYASTSFDAVLKKYLPEEVEQLYKSVQVDDGFDPEKAKATINNDYSQFIETMDYYVDALGLPADTPVEKVLDILQVLSNSKNLKQGGVSSGVSQKETEPSEESQGVSQNGNADEQKKS